MLRLALLAAAVAAAATAGTAADPDLSGNWVISYSIRPGFETNFAVVRIETKDGKPAATVLSSPQFQTGTVQVTAVTVSGKNVTVELSIGPSFEGTVGDDPKVIRGNFGDADRAVYRGRMTRTEEEKAPPSAGRGEVPPPFTELTKLQTAVTTARVAVLREKDAAKKKELAEKVVAAQKEADDKAPALYREVLAKHADSPAAIDAALGLLAAAGKAKLTAAEVGSAVATLEKLAAAYGPRYTRAVVLQAAGSLTGQDGMAAAAAGLTGKLTAALTDADPAAYQVKVLGAHKAALAKAGKADEAKAVDARLAKVEEKLDAEYLAKYPPPKAEPFAGRKDPKANKVAVLELFTGAQCPPCVAADVAFDALAKAYRPADLVLIQYHLHIPGPDPLTNPDAVARWEYYRKAFPEDVRGTPTTAFNGKPAVGGGGARGRAPVKLQEYVDHINPILEERTAVKLTGSATRSGDRIGIDVTVDGADPADGLRLRLVVVEETVRFTGGNGLRFHHHVVRAMPGGADGVAVKDKTFKHTAAADVAAIRAGLEKYLDGYAATRPFPQPGRPLDLGHLKVIALVQNDKTHEIVQAVQLDVGGAAVGAR